MSQTVIQVRLEGPSQDAVRHAAKEMGVQVSNVKGRSSSDVWHLYGSKIINRDHPLDGVTLEAGTIGSDGKVI